MRCYAVAFQTVAMFTHAIALVFLPRIPWILYRELFHHPITDNFRNDRCRRDGKRLSVTFDDGVGGAGQVRGMFAVN